MRELFDKLARMGLGRTKFERRLTSLDKSRLVDIVEQANSILPQDVTPDRPRFTFHASSSLAGMPMPCANAECRMLETTRLAQFAALYADRVFVQPCLATATEIERDEIDAARYRIQSDLAVLYALQPLLEADLIRFLPRPAYCEKHWRSAFERTAVDQAERALLDDLKANVQMSLSIKHGAPVVHFDGPDELVPHGHSIIVLTGERTISVGRPADREGARRIIGRDRIRFLKDYAWPTLYDVFLQRLYGTLAGAAYLTDRSIDGIALDAVGGKASADQSAALKGAFIHSLPFLAGVPVQDLLRLRNREAEAFAVYRDTLSLAVKECGGKDVAAARELFSDVVQPELNKIDAAVRNARERLRAKVRRDVLLGSGVVSIGLASGFLAPNVAAVLTAMGGIKYGLDLLHSLTEALKQPTVARDSEYYFLWRVREESKRRGTA